MNATKTIPENHPIKQLFRSLTERGSLQVQLRDSDVLYYLANLMVDFMFVENMYRIRDAENRRVEHLVDMLKQAVERDMPVKKEFYKHVGDFSLFTLGIFPESIEKPRRVSSKSFYNDAGRIGYMMAGELESSSPHMVVFRKLADEFERCVLSLNWVREYATDPFYQYMLRDFGVI